jgi:hypothetical protein
MSRFRCQVACTQTVGLDTLAAHVPESQAPGKVPFICISVHLKYPGGPSWIAIILCDPTSGRPGPNWICAIQLGYIGCPKTLLGPAHPPISLFRSPSSPTRYRLPSSCRQNLSAPSVQNRSASTPIRSTQVEPACPVPTF